MVLKHKVKSSIYCEYGGFPLKEEYSRKTQGLPPGLGYLRCSDFTGEGTKATVLVTSGLICLCQAQTLQSTRECCALPLAKPPFPLKLHHKLSHRRPKKLENYSAKKPSLLLRAEQ